MIKTPIRYSVVIPIFNATPTIHELCSRLIDCLDSLGKPYEIILVDDCSLDSSWPEIRILSAGNTNIRGFQLLKNSGQGAATMAGLHQSRGQLVITMDDDLQNPPTEILKLIKFMEDNPTVDAAFGRPREKQHSFWRRAGSEIVNRLSNLMFEQYQGFKLTSFRIMRREVVLPLLRINMPEPPIGALISTFTNRIINVDVEHEERRAGQSGYTIRKLLQVSFAKFLGFSTFPLRLLATLGVTGIVVSFVLGIYILTRYLIGSVEVPGWTTLTLLLIGVSGFMFLAFGIIGEYLQQILINTRRNPNFIIRAEIENRTAVHDDGKNSTLDEKRKPSREQR